MTPKRPLSTKWLLLGSGPLVLFGASWWLLSRSGKESSIAERTPVAAQDSGKMPTATIDLDLHALAREGVSASESLSSEAQQAIEGHFREAKKLLEKLEEANAAREVFKFEKSEVVTLTIKPLDPERLAPLYTFLTKAGNTFPKNSLAAEAFRLRADKMVQDLGKQDPTPNRLICVTEKDSGGITFMEAKGGDMTVGRDGLVNLTADSVNYGKSMPEKYQRYFPKP